MKDSSIEWTNNTFNPWWGCVKVSPGCQNCYALTLSKRWGYDIWGPAKTTQRRMMSENYWKQPIKWNRDAAQAGERKRVFCASMADWLEDHPQLIKPRARLLQLIHDTPSLDWLLLSKRPEGWGERLHEVVRYTHDGADMLASQWLDGDAPANVWVGTSIEDQQRADERIPALLDVPAVVRFLSCEPLLGPLDLRDYLTDGAGHWRKPNNAINWIICGGESGHGARWMQPAWARSLRNQCLEADVAFLFKQWGQYLPCDQSGHPGSSAFQSIGKHAAGRLLDGRTWDEYPVPAQ